MFESEPEPAEVEASSSGLTMKLHLTDSPLLPHCGQTPAMLSMETTTMRDTTPPLQIPPFKD